MKPLIDLTCALQGGKAVHYAFGNIGGGMLEFVKMEDFSNSRGEKWVRMYFTNHDVQATKNDIKEFPESQQHLLEGGEHFVIEFPRAF